MFQVIRTAFRLIFQQTNLGFYFSGLRREILLRIAVNYSMGLVQSNRFRLCLSLYIFVYRLLLALYGIYFAEVLCETLKSLKTLPFNYLSLFTD